MAKKIQKMILEERELNQAIKEYIEKYYPEWHNKRAKFDFYVDGEIFPSIRAELTEIPPPRGVNK